MPGLCPAKPFGVKGCTIALNGDHVAQPLGPKGWWGEITSFRAVRLACVIRFRDIIITGAATVHSTFVLSRVWAWWRALLSKSVSLGFPGVGPPVGGVAPGLVLDTHQPEAICPMADPGVAHGVRGGDRGRAPSTSNIQVRVLGPHGGGLGLAGST